MILRDKIAFRHGGRDVGDVAHLSRQVAGHGVDALRQIPPRSRDAFHIRLPAQLTFGTDFARHARHFRGKRAELIHHGVDGVLQLQNFAAHLHGDLARKIASGYGGSDFGDVTHLIGQVRRHGVDGIGKILPDAADALHLRLAAELAFGTDFARHARHFAGERVELIDHDVDGVLQLQNFAAHVHRDLARQVAVRDGRGDFGDVTNLRGQVAGHGIDRIGEILPDAADPSHFGLTAEFAFRTDFARHARDFAGERVQLIHHGVDGVLQLQNFAAHIDRDLARKIAVGDSRGHFRDVADLSRQVAGHGVDAFRQILPDAADALHLRLAAQLAFRADFARHARDFGGEAN